MYSHSSARQNQSEEKGFVTPSFSLSRCNMTLEKTDQEVYFWTQLSIASPLTFKVVLSCQILPLFLWRYKCFVLLQILIDSDRPQGFLWACIRIDEKER